MRLRRVRIVLLCEDTQQETFVRRFLKGMGWETREMRVERSPAARGSGEQWVRLNFLKELKAYRTRRRQAASALIVMIDADTKGIQGRFRDLENECNDNQIPFRAPDEAVAIVVPKRNIETWIYYLQGQTVNEESEYPKIDRQRNCQPSVNRLVQLCISTGLGPDAPPSLLAACDEYRIRIRPFSS